MPQVNDLLHHERAEHYGRSLASLLDAQPLPHDIAERLRVARMQALIGRKKEISVHQWRSVPIITRSGSSAVIGNGTGFTWTAGLAGALAMLALAVGLVVAGDAADENLGQEIALVDVQILTDDLPPSAHADAGFAQFLKFGLSTSP